MGNMSIRLGIIGSLYFSQGLPYGFFAQALPAMMRRFGFTLESISLSTFLVLPWALKFLWAPYVDATAHGDLGRRRRWILPLLGGTIALLVSLSALDPSREFLWVLFGVFAINVMASTQDIATDGLAIEMMPREARGWANGVQVGAYRLGMILGGGVILMVLDQLGWQRAFLCMAFCLLLASLPIFLHREEKQTAAPITRPWPVIKGFFAQRGAWRWLLLLALYKSFDALAGPMLKPMMIDEGYSLTQIGLIVGTVGSIAGLLGAIAGGYGVARLGRIRALLYFGAFQVIAVTGYVLPALGVGGEETLTVVVFCDTFFGSMATTALFTMMMDACRLGLSGSDYTLQASLIVLVVSFVSSTSGFLASAIGYAKHFAITGCLTGMGWLGVWSLLRCGPLLPSLQHDYHTDQMP
mgnify:CR=1 FL=1